MRFSATYRTVKNAQEFADNAERTVSATSIERKGKIVEFDAPIVDSDGYSIYGDVQLSAGYYGATKLNGRSVPREY